MVLWTWGRELEDNFDKENKRNLSRIIFRRSPGGLNADAKKSGGDGITGPPAFRLVPLPEDDEPSILGLGETDTIPRIYPGTTDLSREDESALFIRGQNHELIELQKISTVAFFHKTTDGKGTPFAFNVFMRQVPALPRVVVSVNDGVAPVYCVFFFFLLITPFFFTDVLSDFPLNNHRSNPPPLFRSSIPYHQSPIARWVLRRDDEEGIPR